MRHIPPLLAAALAAAACGNPTQPDPATSPSLERTGTVQRAVFHVANPTGNPATDAANIETAVEEATPGALIQFAQGTYRILETTRIVVAAPGVTLQGHRLGTTIRGVSGVSEFFQGHFRLLGGNQTVSNLNFRDFTAALTIGDPGSSVGGYRVVNSRFRNGTVAINYVTFSEEVTTIQDNEFIDLALPFVILGKTVHFTKNRITVPNPEQTVFGQPFNAGVLAPDLFFRICENNVFSDNTIVGNADGFIVDASLPGEICRNNVISANIFRDQRVFSPGDNGTMVWAFGIGVRENLILENELRGSQGLGIILEAGRRNRIVRNEFRNLPGLADTENPFPGTAIFLDERSRANRVIDNEFTNVVRGIRDLGTDNIIRGNDPTAAGNVEPEVVQRTRALDDNPKLRFLRAYIRPKQ